MPIHTHTHTHTQYTGAKQCQPEQKNNVNRSKKTMSTGAKTMLTGAKQCHWCNNVTGTEANMMSKPECLKFAAKMVFLNNTIVS